MLIFGLSLDLQVKSRPFYSRCCKALFWGQRIFCCWFFFGWLAVFFLRGCLSDSSCLSIPESPPWVLKSKLQCCPWCKQELYSQEAFLCPTRNPVLVWVMRMDQMWRGSAALQLDPPARTLNPALPKSRCGQKSIFSCPLTHHGGSDRPAGQKALCTWTYLPLLHIYTWKRGEKNLTCFCLVLSEPWGKTVWKQFVNKSIELSKAKY